MLINITKRAITAGDIAFIDAALSHEGANDSGDKQNISVIVFSGDGVYAQHHLATTEHVFKEQSIETSAAKLYAVADDVASRGVKPLKHLALISAGEFAALSGQHQHWVAI
ncbi:hypothetical protein CW735_09420 [Alteromonas sp. MB-3u-76]|uniref:DsrH/TusB family sulfur metabolism protein n=1 Tax=unclassified Alteromonas TaxID=2614992 RepID=UPI000903A863|nr:MULTISPECIES: DsrH/TusB family sulfur metabolism protein [unclassified Alteromonas]APE05262.1 hypothetical protein BM528_05275 [Alteromonas sp. RW2A1]AUC88376.1 hypothetical protein CW735_09420 [Alteromonas sp. MB-3u-76]